MSFSTKPDDDNAPGGISKRQDHAITNCLIIQHWNWKSHFKNVFLL